MSTITNARKAASEFFAAAKTIDGAVTGYNLKAEAAVKADVPMLLATGELSQRELAHEAGLSDAAGQYHAAVLEACVYESAGVTPAELRSMFVACHKTAGVSLSAVRAAVRNMSDKSTRADVVRLVRSHLTAVDADGGKVKGKDKTPEPVHKTITRSASAMSNVKTVVGADLAASAAALALVKAEVRRLEALIIAASIVTADEVTADEDEVVTA